MSHGRIEVVFNPALAKVLYSVAQFVSELNWVSLDLINAFNGLNPLLIKTIGISITE